MHVMAQKIKCFSGSTLEIAGTHGGLTICVEFNQQSETLSLTREQSHPLIAVMQVIAELGEIDCNEVHRVSEGGISLIVTCEENHVFGRFIEFKVLTPDCTFSDDYTVKIDLKHASMLKNKIQHFLSLPVSS
jgi:hypothetical protein